MQRKDIAAILLGTIAILPIVFAVVRSPCPSEGFAFTESRRAVHRLKNRTAIPSENDFNRKITLAQLLEPASNQNRWSESNAARIEGYVVSVEKAGVELANCYLGRDIHINLALRPDATVGEQIVVEVTPHTLEWAKKNGNDWSAGKLKSLIGHWCAFEGWLFYDEAHAEESENISPGQPKNWRGTAWELHPVTRFEVLK